MRIIIVGAGKVGFTLAEHLSREKHDITIIDNKKEAIRHASEALDVMCIEGNGASPTLLKSAGVDSADFLLATTNLDEVNMLCSFVAKHFGAKYTIARIRDIQYTDELAYLQKDMRIDMIINPEHSTAVEISHLLRFPAAANIDTFFRGRVELLSTQVKAEDFIVGQTLSDSANKLQSLPILFCAAQRGEDVIIPNGDFIPKIGDRLYVVGSPAGLQQYFRLLDRFVSKVNSVFILGGSRISHYLAKRLESMHIKVTIVEKSENSCRTLSEKLPQALVLHGDGTDRELLETEHFEKHDAFVALTGRDEDNLLMSLYAQQQKIKKVIAKCNRENYINIAHSAGLESILSPKIITVGRILRAVRSFNNTGDSIKKVALFRFEDNAMEVSEFEIHQDTMHLNTPLKDLPLKHGVLIAAIMRREKLTIPSGNTTLHAGDRVIVVTGNQTLKTFNDIYKK